jgi:hypothetical protein
MTSIDTNSADFISSEVLAGLYLLLITFVVPRSLKLFCIAELVLCITRTVYVAM